MSAAAVSAGKSLRYLSRALGRRGEGAQPSGPVAAKVDPGLIPVLAAGLGGGSALVTGTKGKTTTTRIMARAARSAGLSVITNLDGSSLLSGIATSLAACSGRGGALRQDNAAIGLFEVDEGALPNAIGMLDPRLVVITNLFREQPEASRWQPALRGLAPDACVVLNADDPAVAFLGERLPAEVVYFGLNDRQWARTGRRGASGSRRCPRCGHDLRYELSFYAHLGHYACEHCDWRRPDPRFAAKRVRGAADSRCQVSTPTRTFTLPLAGLYDASHVLAAAAGASCLGFGPVPGPNVAGYRRVGPRGPDSQPMDIDAIVAQVATAVGLAEGESGVRDVLRVIARHEPVPTSQISREAELPVPIVTAVCNELRKRVVVDSSRPVRLTPAARELIGTGRVPLAVECPGCGGLGLRTPGELAPLVAVLEQAAAGAPQARMELDQSHCTVSTKVHRVLRLHQAGALDGKNVVLLGDDDLISVAIAGFTELAGAAAGPRLVTVIDADPAVLGWIGEQTARAPVPVRLIEHDLRLPLPSGLAGTFDVACTDPPYTEAGAELFLSRAVDALARRPGQHVFFSYGARRPAQALATQRLIAGLGLVIRSLAPNFNSYVGAGILAGASHLYHLRTTEGTAPLIDGEYAGSLYTADGRAAQDRPYRCARCGASYLVGRTQAADWAQIADLQAAGCPACGGTKFAPGPRLHPR